MQKENWTVRAELFPYLIQVLFLICVVDLPVIWHTV